MLWAAFVILPMQDPNLPAGPAPGGVQLLNPDVKPAIEDTYVAKETPDANFGRSEVFIAGPDHMVLIRPTDLRVQSGGRRVKSASLILPTSDPKAPTFTQVAIIRKPWFEGPGRAPGADGTLLKWAATWNHARSGQQGQKWQRAGLQGAEDVEAIQGVTSSFGEGAVTLSGLGTALQQMLEQPDRAFGIAFTTQGRIQFLSSEFAQAGPRFQIEWEQSAKADGPDLQVAEISQTAPMPVLPEEGASLTWEAKIRNIGTQPSGPGIVKWTLRWNEQATVNLPSVGPGETGTATITLPYRRDADKRLWMLGARVEATGDTDASNNYREVALGAIPVALSQGDAESQAKLNGIVDYLNDHAFPMSRFGFAIEGVTERVRYVSDPARALRTISSDQIAPSALLSAVLNMPSGFWNPPGQTWITAASLTADSRDEWSYMGGIPYPELYWPPRILGQPAMPQTGLLGRNEAAVLMSQAGRNEPAPLAGLETANVLIVRLFDSGGRAIKNAKVQVFQPTNAGQGAAVAETELTGGGSILLTARSFKDGRETLFGPIQPDGSNSWLMLEFEANGDKVSRWVSYTQLVAETLRGGRSAASLEYRLMLPDLPIDRNENLAKGRPAEDSYGRFPAELMSLTDEDLSTSLDFPGEEGWVEFDLGRDRLVGEVELVFEGAAPWDSYAVSVYNTGQEPGAARVWVNELNGAWRALAQEQLKDGRTRVRYTGGSINARYLRLTKRQGSARLAEIIIHPSVPAAS